MLARVLEGISILEQVSEPSEILKQQAAARLYNVEGEFEDEDGDWATGFILADPKPRKEAASWSYAYNSLAVAHRWWQTGRGDSDGNCSWSSTESGDSNSDVSCHGCNELEKSRSSTFSSKKRRFGNDDGELCGSVDSGDLGMFSCQFCQKDLPLEHLWPELKCSCLCCKPCVQQYVESCLARVINGTWKPCDVGRRRPVVKGNNIRGDGAAAFEMVSLRKTLESFDCPAGSCMDSISLSSAQLLAPELFKTWQESVNQDLFETDAFVSCPGCGVTIEKVIGDLPPGVSLTGVPEIDRTAPYTERDNDGRVMSRTALCHKATNYFCCPLCKAGFCGLCLASPYHLGKTCEEFQEEKNAVKCLYCGAPILTPKDVDKQSSSGFVKALRRELDKQGLDLSWCVEKSDLAYVKQFASTVCGAQECKARLSKACTRRLECGHHCGGLRGELQCLPCLENDCHQNTSCSGANYLPSADELCSICMVEPLSCAPSIQLVCGHVVHFDCAKKQLKEGFPGPEISFRFLNCPLCPQLMQHITLAHYMKDPLQLMNLVKGKALNRLKMEEVPPFIAPKELDMYALQMYQYYICCKCQRPYFGGKRDCMAGLQDHGNENLHNPLDLVCGGCSAATVTNGICKKGHGKEFIEFKCRFCCSIATYFCFGRIHFCDKCHQQRPDLDQTYVPKICKGPEWCPLRVAHASNGEESCLGCSMCRLLSQ